MFAVPIFLVGSAFTVNPASFALLAVSVKPSSTTTVLLSFAVAVVDGVAVVASSAEAVLAPINRVAPRAIPLAKPKALVLRKKP